MPSVASMGRGPPRSALGRPVEVGGRGAHGSLGLSCLLRTKTRRRKPASEDRPNHRTCRALGALSPNAVEPKGERKPLDKPRVDLGLRFEPMEREWPWALPPRAALGSGTGQPVPEGPVVVAVMVTVMLPPRTHLGRAGGKVTHMPRAVTAQEPDSVVAHPAPTPHDGAREAAEVRPSRTFMQTGIHTDGHPQNPEAGVVM